MNIQKQFYQFYRPYLRKICQNIKEGKVLLIVGINSIGKTLLTLQLQSDRFNKEFIKEKNIKLIFLEFKDKNPPNPEQLYNYWLKETAKALDYSLPLKEEINDFSFYFHLSEMMKKLKDNEKLVYIVLDAENILNQKEAFYKSLIYLHRFTYKKISYIFLSEPQILECSNIWAQRFIQDSTNYKFLFLKLFDRKRSLVDITREEGFLKTKLSKKHRLLIRKFAGGLHGVIGALAYFLKDNPHVANIKQLKEIVFNDKMYQYWIEDILQSLPLDSYRILKEVVSNKNNFKKYKRDIHGKWLIDLGFLKKNGTFRHPLMIPYVENYKLIKDSSPSQIRLVNHQFYLRQEMIKLTKRETLVLEVLYKSKGKLVTYDEIGEVLWKDQQDKFSLWAISQIILRLRKKLSSYYLNPKIIRSERGEGYVFNGYD